MGSGPQFFGASIGEGPLSYGNYPDLSKIKKILVIKLRHLGDVLLTSPVFLNLRAAVPQATIDVMIYREAVPMLKGNPLIHKLITYDQKWKKNRFFKRIFIEFFFLRMVRQQRYDLVINLTEGDRGAIVAFVSGARISVGFDPEGKGFLGKRGVYTHLVKVCKTPRHAVERNLDAIRRIGIFPSSENRELYFNVDEEKPYVRQLLRETSIKPYDYLLLHPISRWKFKCPPSSLMARLLLELLQRGEQIILTSGPDLQELQMIEEILKQVPPTTQVLNLAGKTSLKGLGALIQLSRCLISVDSVALHMASALKVPVVALFGPSSELNWGPWQHEKGRVITEPLSCRPCFIDGCGGSKMSDCLYTLPISRILQGIDEVIIPK